MLKYSTYFIKNEISFLRQFYSRRYQLNNSISFEPILICVNIQSFGDDMSRENFFDRNRFFSFPIQKDV